MKSVLWLFSLLCAASLAQAQKMLLLKKLLLADDMKIIGLTDRFDSLGVHRKYSFYCKNKAEVKDIRESLYVNGKVKQEGWNNELHIYIVKGKEIQPIQIMVNPKVNNVNTNVLGEFNYYGFDVTQLSAAHLKYPVEYTCKWMDFDSKAALDNFIAAHKEDPAFLCYENETPELPGRCIIKMQPDKVVSDYGKAEDYVEAVFKKIAKNENDYSVGFIPEQGVEWMRIEVDCRKELCDKITDTRLGRRTWKSNPFSLLTYWLK